MPSPKKMMMAAAGSAGGGAAGSIWAWGLGTNGANGQGNTTTYSSPVQVGAETDWVQQVMGPNSHWGVRSDGTLWGWGDNTSGQIGNGNTTHYSSPIQIGSATDWADEGVSLSKNNLSSAYIKADGKLWCWGANSYGQGGHGNTTVYSSPVQVGALTDWASVWSRWAGKNATKTDGTLWGWGAGGFGGGGWGSSTSYSSPIQIGALTDWGGAVFPTAEGNNVGAVKADGTLWGWGRNYYGSLMLGNTTAYSSPVQVGSDTNWADVAADEWSRVAIRTDGTLWAAGKNNVGQLGLGNKTNYSSPVQVGSLTDWAEVQMAFAYVLARKTDGTIWSWGAGTNGQKGSGSTASTSSPVQIGAAADWLLIPKLGSPHGGGGVRQV
jgi:alpha-tubulin suppressor-like RCC1 family protein